MKLDAILEEYLRSTGGLEPVKLGTRAQLSPSQEASERFATGLNGILRESTRRLAVIVTLYVVLFAFLMFLVIWQAHSRGAVTLVGGISLGSFLAILKYLQQLWYRKCTVDVLICTLPNLSPEDAIKAVQAVFFNRKARARRTPK